MVIPVRRDTVSIKGNPQIATLFEVETVWKQLNRIVATAIISMNGIKAFSLGRPLWFCLIRHKLPICPFILHWELLPQEHTECPPFSALLPSFDVPDA